LRKRGEQPKEEEKKLLEDKQNKDKK